MFKNVMAYKMLNPATKATLMSPSLEMFAEDAETYEPHGSSWRTYGYSKLEKFGDRFVFDGAMGARVLNVVIQERVLPGPVIRKAVVERAEEFKSRENRDAHRQELAQFKDEVVAKLLPKAFIREKHHLVMITGDWVLIDTGSSKTGEEICSFMRESLTSTGLSLRPLQGQKSQQWLKEIALADSLPERIDPDDEIDENAPVPTANFYHMESVVLKGAGVIRIKDMDFDVDAVSEALRSGMNVIELAVAWGKNPGVPDLMCAVNDNLAIKRLKFSDLMMRQALDEAGDESEVAFFDASVAIASDLLKTFINSIEAACYTEEDEAPLDDGFLDDGMTMTFVSTATPVEQEWDDLLESAAKEIITSDNASLSHLQRVLRIGYNRTARIMDQLHNIGCLSSMDHMNGRRTIIWNPEDLEEFDFSQPTLDDDDEL